MNPAPREPLSDAKRALLERRLRGSAPPAQIPRVGPDARVAPSRGQERILFLQSLLPESTAYNMHEAYRCLGPLDVDRLEQALRAVAARHDALRTCFAPDQSGWRLDVSDDVRLSVGRFDLSAAAGRDLDDVIKRFAVERAQIRFDLERGPLLDLSVARVAEHDHVICLTIHHAISDEWSLDILWKDLASAYSGAALETLPIGYRDIAHHERASADAHNSAASIDYWRRALAPPLPVADLPTDRPRPARSAQRGGFIALPLAHSDADAVRVLAKRLGATTFMVGLAAVAALLHRHTQQEDWVIGTPIARRNAPGAEQLVGFFLNTIALRLNVGPDATFEALAAHAKAAAAAAFAHADVPFDEVVRLLPPTRVGSGTPAFQVMFVHQGERAAPAFTGVSVHALPVDAGVAKFDLTFFLAERGRDIELGVEYDAELYDRETAGALLRRLGAVLSQAAADPMRAVGDLTMLDEAERARVTREWNGSALDVPAHATIHALIEACARRNPASTAIITDAGRMTYAELNDRADWLASRLVDEGVAPDTPVAVCANRSADMIVAVLGVLKAGGAYVPIDPAYPPERIAFMLADTRARWVVGQESLAPLFPGSHAQWIGLESLAAETRARPAAARPPVPADALAYVIYTSGSTGRPKGVMITHRNLVHSTLARFAEYAQPPGRFLLLSSFAFDSSVAGIFWTLCSGGALVLPAGDGEKDVRGIAAMIGRHAVTHTLCLPSLYDLLIEFAAPGQLDTLRTVIVAGEACPAALVRAHHRSVPGARLYNEYGPTEGTVWCTVHALTPDTVTPVPIGRPIRGMRAYVLDARGRLAPTGVIGELYIGGTGIARGYWERADLTRERFAPAGQWLTDAGADVAPDATLYRTGDRARWLVDGTLQYFGRTDDQVKVRGHRVELGEVEHALRSIGGVSDAAAFVLGEGPQARLMACVVTAAPPEGLRAALRALVPDALVPSALVPVAELPRLPNGKVDRSALAGLAPLDAPQPQIQPDPASETERRLAELWREVLGIATVGTHADFFELGGHSLAAIRLAARIQEAFGLKIPVSAVLAHPTVAGLAVLVDGPPPAVRTGPLIALRAARGRPPFFCVHGFGGGVASYLPMAQAAGDDQPFFAFQARGFDFDGEPHDSIEEMAAYYVAAMKAAHPAGPYYLGGHCFGGVVAYEMARQLSAQGESVGCVALFDSFTPVVPSKQVALAHPIAFATNGVRLVREIGPGYYARLIGRVLRRRALGRRGRAQTPGLSLDDVLPNAGELPDDIRQLTEAHLRAMSRYRMGPYAGSVDLFTVGTRPLFRAHERLNGWETWALGGVRVWPIRGTHRTIILDPSDASDLGRSLRACLDRAYARGA